MDACARPHVDDIVGVADRILVMLDDDHAVAQVAQALQGHEQTVIVALVQADRGFIEDVEDAGQPATDLGRQANALGFATGQRAAGAIEVEIIETDIVEEAQALDDFLENGLGDLVLLIVELVRHRGEEIERVHDRSAGGEGNILARNLDRQRFGFEARTVAGFAGLGALIFAQFLAHPGGFGLQQTAVEIADDALKRFLHLIALAAIHEFQGDRLAAGTVQDDELHFARQVRPGCVEAEAEFLGQRAEHLHIIGTGRVGFCPGDDRALFEAQGFVGDDQFGVELQPFAKAVARRAGAHGRVKGKEARLDLRDGETADGTSEFFTEHDAVGGDAGPLHLLVGGGGFILAARHDAIGQIDIGQAVGKFERLLETVGEAGAHVVFHGQAVDHDFDVMLIFLVERGGVLDQHHFAVDAYSGIARLLPFGQFLAIFALPPAHDGRKEVKARALRQQHHAIDHLADGLGADRQAGGGAVGDADPRP